MIRAIAAGDVHGRAESSTSLGSADSMRRAPSPVNRRRRRSMPQLKKVETGAPVDN